MLVKHEYEVGLHLVGYVTLPFKDTHGGKLTFCSL